MGHGTSAMTGLPRQLLRRARRLARRGGRAADAAHTPPPVTDDIRAWCAGEPNATYQPVLGPQRIVRDPPRTVEPGVHPVFEQYYEVDAPEHALVGIPEGRVAPNGIVFLPDGSLVGDAVTSQPEFRPLILAGEPAYAQPLPTRTRELSGNWYSMVIANAGNYFHWQQDVMMRIPAVLPHLPSDVGFIVPPHLTDFHHAMLAATGVAGAELRAYSPDEVWVCERLYLCTPYLKPMLHTAHFMQQFVDRCLATYGIARGEPVHRVYITRRRDSHWRARNEGEVMSILEQYGFELHDLGLLDFRQQIELFAHAQVVVGTGAGLSNIVFAPRGAKIVQLQDPTYPVGHHFTIASALGHEYWYFFCEAIPNPASRYGRSNLRVPLDKLRTTIDHLLAEM